MAFKRKPRIIDWLVCIIPILLGLGAIWAYAFNRLAGSTPEKDLTEATGVPADVQLKRPPQRIGQNLQILEFSVNAFRMEYGSDRPKFREIQNAVTGAVTNAEPIRVWVSTKMETLVSRPGFVPLYKVNVGDQPILTYRETSAFWKDGSSSVLIVGCALLGLGILVLGLCIRSYRQHTAPGGVRHEW
jgi:hypothetical protein